MASEKKYFGNDYVSKLPCYADHPANGDRAGQAFVPGRDGAWIVDRAGRVLGVMLYMHEKWTPCAFDRTPIASPDTPIFATREAAQQYADAEGE